MLMQVVSIVSPVVKAEDAKKAKPTDMEVDEGVSMVTSVSKVVSINRVRSRAPNPRQNKTVQGRRHLPLQNLNSGAIFCL